MAKTNISIKNSRELYIEAVARIKVEIKISKYHLFTILHDNLEKVVRIVRKSFSQWVQRSLAGEHEHRIASRCICSGKFA